MCYQILNLSCRYLSVLLGIGLLSMNLSQLSAQTLTSVKSGDRVVFLGDSITKGGGHAKGYLTLFKQGLADQGLDSVEVINAGISGHKVPDLQKRLDKDVLQRKPTHVVIYIGINDVWHSLKGKGTKP